MAKRRRSAKPRPRRDMPETTCDGFVVETDRDDPVAAVAAVRAAVRRVIGDDQGWRVKPLAPGTPDLDLTPPAAWRVRTPGEAFEIARRLERQRHVSSAEAMFVAPGLFDPSRLPPARAGRRAMARSGGGAAGVNPDYEWSVKLAHVPEAWALPPPANGRAYGEGIIVAHPDTGYTTHPEIWDVDPAQRRVRSELGFDYVEGDQSPLDDLDEGFLEFPGHGTSTASVIMSGVGSPTAGAFVSGVAPKAELVPLRVSRSVVHLSMKNVTRAIAQAMALGHHVVSMSLGGPFPSRALRRAIRAAIDEGMILLAAAGNYWPWVVYPAAYDEVIAVAACDHLRRMWQWSATGDTVDVTAPGADVWVARAVSGNPPAYKVGAGSGTSFAVATTAGLAALWLAYHGRAALVAKLGKPNLALAFRNVLVTHGIEAPAGWDTEHCGAGIVNAEKLLQAPVPAVPAAPRFLRRAPRAPRAPWAHYFPDLDEEVVERALAETLGAKSPRLAKALATLGDEIVFLLATEPDLRQAVRERATGQRAVRAARTRGPAAATAVLRKMSPTLRKQLGR